METKTDIEPISVFDSIREDKQKRPWRSSFLRLKELQLIGPNVWDEGFYCQNLIFFFQPGPDSVGIFAISQTCSGVIVEILKHHASWFRNCRNLKVYTMFPAGNGGAIDLIYNQIFAPTTPALARDLWTFRYTTSLENGSLMVCERSLTGSGADPNTATTMQFEIGEIGIWTDDAFMDDRLHSQSKRFLLDTNLSFDERYMSKGLVTVVAEEAERLVFFVTKIVTRGRGYSDQEMMHGFIERPLYSSADHHLFVPRVVDPVFLHDPNGHFRIIKSTNLVMGILVIRNNPMTTVVEKWHVEIESLECIKPEHGKDFSSGLCQGCIPPLPIHSAELGNIWKEEIYLGENSAIDCNSSSLTEPSLRVSSLGLVSSWEYSRGAGVSSPTELIRGCNGVDSNSGPGSLVRKINRVRILCLYR
ncbi:hypothetical protein OSB04_015859 [Centaurea solstitialis]|uniref:START domain-containing protein n=1 Tax=Centaurea solstitialis TaxID=347529 RepID=A0AA38T1G5_9ASTR|nr:hypothetical protein OSB04_015859 [Centaurea solstitialis]